MCVIETENLSKDFGKIKALRNLNFEVEKGQLFGFIGPNGAGKTTTINILTGQIEPSSGSCTVMDLDPIKNPVEVRRKIGILPEREDPPSFFTPREYFEFVAEVRGIKRSKEKVKEWAKRLKFSDKLDILNKDLSKGEKQKVMVSQAFLHEPDLVFIDEPLINLDPVVQEELKKFFSEYKGKGKTIFLSTHVMNLAEDLCSHVAILDNGELIVSGPKEELKEGKESLTDTFLRLVENYESS